MTTGIQWTDETWNPTVGCSKISEGCWNCYAIPMAARLEAMAIALENEGKSSGRLEHYKGLTEKRKGRTEWTGAVNFVPEALQIPLRWKKSRRIFVNSMSDLFHESVPDEWIDRVFAVMAMTPHHVYQILTKRPERMLEYFTKPDAEDVYAQTAPLSFDQRMEGIGFGSIFPLENVWLGVTVENQKAADERIPLLLQTPAALRFLSCEPLLEEIKIPHIESIGWVICGGESGHGARSCNIDHLNSIVEQCRYAQVPAFVKQLGAHPFSRDEDEIRDDPMTDWGISDKKGAIVSEWPDYLQVQESPQPF
jgi:protein gp37